MARLLDRGCRLCAPCLLVLVYPGMALAHLWLQIGKRYPFLRPCSLRSNRKEGEGEIKVSGIEFSPRGSAPARHQAAGVSSLHHCHCRWSLDLGFPAIPSHPPVRRRWSISASLVAGFCSSVLVLGHAWGACLMVFPGCRYTNYCFEDSDRKLLECRSNELYSGSTNHTP